MFIKTKNYNEGGGLRIYACKIFGYNISWLHSSQMRVDTMSRLIDLILFNVFVVTNHFMGASGAGNCYKFIGVLLINYLFISS